ncbi:FAD/NAD(P)-binding domain-containing protein [Penicillium sp. IBT 18751x]|nr:FAD/NAD(P)-binding domain-containing protein [Penicillium sp. IBT 18751x]
MLSDGSVLEAEIYIPVVGTTPNKSFIYKSLLVADCRMNVTDKLRVERAGGKSLRCGRRGVKRATSNSRNSQRRTRTLCKH